jgi:hypothetical protein
MSGIHKIGALAVTVFTGISAIAATVPGPPIEVQLGPQPVSGPYGPYVSWAAPTSNGGDSITGYKVVAIQDTSRYCTAPANGELCQLTGLPFDSIYTFAAYALNSAGSSAASSPTDSFKVEYVDSQTVSVTPENGQVYVSWTPYPPPECFGWRYAVISHPSSNGCVPDNGIGLNCTVTGLTNGVQYTFTVENMTMFSTGGCAQNGGVTSITTSDTVTPLASLAITSIYPSEPMHVRINGSSLLIQLPKISKNAQLSIVDFSGKTLWNKTVAAGTQEISWDENSGRYAELSGIYILRLEALDGGAHASSLIAESKVLLTP